MDPLAGPLRLKHLDFDGAIHIWWQNPSTSQLPSRDPVFFVNTNGQTGVPLTDIQSWAPALESLMNPDQICHLVGHKIVFGVRKSFPCDPV